MDARFAYYNDTPYSLKLNTHMKKEKKSPKKQAKMELENFPESDTRLEDYIRACTDALDVIDQYDFALMEPAYKERAEAMKLKIFDMLEYSINELYQELEFVLPENQREEEQ